MERKIPHTKTGGLASKGLSPRIGWEMIIMGSRGVRAEWLSCFYLNIRFASACN